MPAASVAPVLPAFYRELYQAMESIAQSLEYDIPQTLEWIGEFPNGAVEEVLALRDRRNHTSPPTVEDVETFVAFMRDGIRAREVTP